MSCRVLKRGVEHALLRELGEVALAAGCARVSVGVAEAPRNRPIRLFLEGLAQEAPQKRREHGRGPEGEEGGGGETGTEEGEGADAEKIRPSAGRPLSPICRTPFPPYVRNEFSFFVRCGVSRRRGGALAIGRAAPVGTRRCVIPLTPEIRPRERRGVRVGGRHAGRARGGIGTRGGKIRSGGTRGGKIRSERIRSGRRGWRTRRGRRG